MKRTNLKFFSAAILLASFLLTGGIFAYWAESVQGDSDSLSTSITIGAGEEYTTTIEMSEVQKTTGKLVPAGYESAGNVSEIVITYDVLLEADEAGAVGAEADLEVTHGALPSTLINVAITKSSGTIVSGGVKVVVTVTVTLDEPANVNEYNEVANLVFNIELTFTATIA